MSGTTHGARTDPRDTLILGIILVAIGVAAVALNAFPDAGALVLLVIGVALLTVFALLHHYAALVPGGIMTGLGAGILASQTWSMSDQQTGGVIVLGLGLGFLSIWAVGALVRVPEHHVWPLVPGGILATIGAALLIGGGAVELLRFWPAILIVIGLVYLWRAAREVRARR